MEFIKNNKGGEKLCYKNYMYTQKSKNETSLRWECSQRKSLSCNGKVVTDLEKMIVLTEISHVHPALSGKVEAAKLKLDFKEKAKECRGSTGQLLVDGIASSSQECRMSLGESGSLKRYIRRYVHEGRPKDPDSLEELIIDGDWKLTDGERFLIYDNGPNSNNRIIIFGTDICLKQLSEAKTWFMDGTFKSAPALFKQIYIIRVPLVTSAISCVYAFLQKKTEDTYEELFSEISALAADMDLFLDPDVVVTDFEMAVSNAINNVLGPQVNTKYCFFHLTQSTWRKVQKLGLTELYRANPEVRHFVGMLDGTAFLDINHIPAAIDHLMHNLPDGLDVTDEDSLTALVTYFDETYVRGTSRRVGTDNNGNAIIRVIPPLFPPHTWNVFQTTLNDEDRTNNFCESWNSSFEKIVGHRHPTVWAAIEALRKDNIMVHTAIEKNDLGERPKKRVRKATTELNLRLKNLCQDYDNNVKSGFEHLISIGHNIHIDKN